MANAFTADIDLLTANDDGLAPAGRNLFTFHTFEGQDLSAEAMARYQLSPVAGGSYHGVIDAEGNTARENDDEYIPWAAMFTGNRAGWHWSLAGRASFTREQWLSRPKQMEKCAIVLAAYAKAKGIPTVKRSHVEVRARQGGVCGHDDISKAWQESDHTDPGVNFPYDVVIARANEIMAGGTAPAPAPERPQPAGEFTGNKYPSYLDGRELRFSEYLRFVDYKITRLYEAEFGTDADLGIKDGTFSAASVGEQYPSYVDASKSFTLDQYLRLIDIKATRLFEKQETTNA